LPDSTVRLPVISKKDEEDLKFGLENDADFIALSFVQSPRDILHLQKLIKQYNPEKYEHPWIIAKIEKGEAVKCLPEVLQLSDGAMVARGDLGVEISAAEVPLVQKQIIELCLRSAKPSIVATQMLDSMVSAPDSHRAEVSDVAGAVIEHVDCVMLSQETAIGKYPVRTVETMAENLRRDRKSLPMIIWSTAFYPIKKSRGLRPWLILHMSFPRTLAPRP